MADTYNLNVYAFLSDTFLWKPDVIEVNDSSNQGVGKLDSKMLDYFNLQTVIKDRRTARSSILSQPAPNASQLYLTFDGSQSPALDIWTRISDDNWRWIFNMLEAAELSQYASANYFNTLFQDDPQYNLVYVPDSFFMASKKAIADVTLQTTQTIEIPEWFSFKVKVDQGNGLFNIYFKVYCSQDAFIKNYDLTTITKVVPPCDPVVFFNAISFKSTFDAISQSVTYSNQLLDEAIRIDDNQGLYRYDVKFVMDPENSVQVPFQLLHKGPKRPSTIDCRKAIKQYLLDGGWVTEENLKRYFPDLFVENLYYVIPLWDEYILRPDRQIYPAISPLFKDIVRKVGSIIDMQADELIQKAELILNAKNDIQSIVVPHPLSTNYLPLRLHYPTYTAYSTHSAEFEYMDPNDRQFASLFLNCMAVLEGTVTSNYYIPVEVEIPKQDHEGYDIYTYLTFSHNTCEFMVLSKESYNKALGIG
jgi:hypothetical protein